MKLSVSTKLYFNYTLEETINRVAAHGYPGIEIWGGRPHAYYRDMDDESISVVKRALGKNGLEVSGFIPAQFGYPTSLCSPLQSIRKDSIEYIKNSIDTSLSLGCKKVSLCPGRTLYGQGYTKGMQDLISSLDQLVEYSLKKGVLLLLEPAHMYESDLVLTIEDGVRLIREQKYPNMGIALDTGHCHVNKESLTDSLLIMNSNNIPVHIHLDDNNGLSDQHKIPGEGTINFIPFLQVLNKSGYDGFLTVELGFDYTADPDAAAYKSKKAVLALLDEAGIEVV
ncbi:MAG: sugar phosphate isomerase/epimerase [Bacteroidales bacterium]|jgi:protein FrlC|nr:sugar phosphate isomerase/epimerase [Bacteroidales bacterium]